MSKLYPLKFLPILKPVLWGGSRIMKFKGNSTSAENIGESWEISGLEGHESIVANGEYEGQDIKTLLMSFGKDILGDNIYSQCGNKFPLLIKFIDASKDLSIQVHPNDELASLRHGCLGKTELWYVVGSEPDSYIYSGFAKEITKDAFLNHIDNHNITDVMAKFIAHPKDIFYLPAGRIHSIGAGNFIVEIQQSSDITYRVYDYNRVDSSGNKREIHAELAKDAIDFNIYDDYKSRATILVNKESILKTSPYFSATIINIIQSFHLDIAQKHSFRILVIIKGEGTLTDNMGNLCTLNQGETVLIPAITEFVDIIPKGEMEIITSYINPSEA